MGKPSVQLIQIVPRLQRFNGVSDYALLLAARLRDAHGVGGTLVTASRLDGDAQELARGLGTHPLRAPTAAALTAALTAAGARGANVLLHYVGYGYARRGAPLWLVRALAGARRTLGFRLGVVFHELYATGPPWTSSFWLSGAQRWIARRIAACSDWALVTREASRQWLERGGAMTGKAVSVVPMCSMVGEPAAPVAPSEARAATLVVWGGRKDMIYRQRWRQLREACRVLAISRIVDIGPAARHYPDDGPSIEPRGWLEAREVGRELQGARFGYLQYPASFLGKSSVYAAYSAHGVACLLDEDVPSRSLDGIEAGRHFLRIDEAIRAGLKPGDADTIAASARQAYEPHALARHAERVLAMARGAA